MLQGDVTCGAARGAEKFAVSLKVVAADPQLV